MNGLSRTEFIELFPGLRHSPENQIREILSTATVSSFTSGMLIYSEGDTCSAIAFLLSGEIRVYKVAESGREITLYEIGSGETCILNASCILAKTPYPANAVSLKEGSMLLVPAAAFRRFMDTSEDMRHFVFEIMNRRLMTVMARWKKLPLAEWT